MTMHEALKFLDALHAHTERHASKPGPWCWPTRELAVSTLQLNRKAFPRDATPATSFRRVLHIACRQHWIAMGPCTPQCHAPHLTLTPAGKEALRLMNADGCGPLCHQHRDTKLHLQRKV